jgi:hypothetical protein
MPYKDKSQMQAAQRRWYLSHKDITLVRTRAWKAKKRMLDNETKSDRDRRRASDYYYAHREEILAKYAKDKKMLVEAATINPDPTYVSPRMIQLIEEFGEAEARWYEDVRLAVLKGISVKTLPLPDQEKWWEYLKRRVNYDASFDQLTYLKNRKTQQPKTEDTYDNEPTEDIDMGTTNETGYSRGCMTYGNSSSIKRGASLRQSPLTPLTPL